MNIIEPISIGLSQLRVHKLRATLSILGILISVGSVTGIVSLGDGLRATVLGQFEEAGGSSQIWVRSPSAWYRNASGYWVQRDWEEYLENRDIGSLRDASPHIKHVVPEIGFGVTVRYRGVVTSANMNASSPQYLKTQMWDMERGRFISDDDVANASKVAVIGAQLAEDLFGEENPLGREIKIDNVRYLVVGLLSNYTMDIGASNERILVIPYTTAQLRITGNQRLNSFTVIASSPEHVPEVVRSLETVMKQNHVHGEDFEVNTGESAIEDFNQVVTILKVVAGGIAGISLLVGGVGIMNIMLVSVSERKREIGIRKAVGAKNANILLQFIIEAMVLCLFGGALGILLGIGLGEFLEFLISSAQSEVPFNSVVTPGLMAFGVLYSALIGMFFGVYPAWRAAKLDPVESLRG